jgi:hypothetical protein
MNVLCDSCSDLFGTMANFVIAITIIALINVLPANQVCGIKYLRKKGSSIALYEIIACIKSIKALVRNPIPIKREYLSFNV